MLTPRTGPSSLQLATKHEWSRKYELVVIATWIEHLSMPAKHYATTNCSINQPAREGERARQGGAGGGLLWQ